MNSNSVPAGGDVPNGTPATFAAILGSVAPPSGIFASGTVGTTYTSISSGVGSASTTVDGQTVSANYTAAACGPNSANVWTDNTTSKTGVGKTIPINTTTLTGLGQDVISADIQFSYDPSVISYVSATPGTVLPGGTTINAVNNPIAGTIIISVYHGAGTPFAGAGTLVDLNFNVIGPIGSSSPLQLTNFWYNGTLVCSNVSSGTLTIISGEVSGQVTYKHQPGVKPVPGVDFNAAGSVNFVGGPSDAAGNYTLSGFGPGAYTVTPSKADKLNPGDVGYIAPNGIFSNDPSLISQHIVGITPITDPVQLEAAWVSEGTTPFLSSFDAALIAQWIVGVNNPLNLTGKWRFTPINRSYPNVITDYAGEDYTALLKGDVNGDWNPAGPLRPAPMTQKQIAKAARVSIPELRAEYGKLSVVPLRIDNLKAAGITSYQFDIEFDPEVVSPAKVAVDIAGTLSESLALAYNSPRPGLLKVVLYGAFPVGGDGVYVNLRFRPVGEIGSSSPLTIKGFRYNDGIERAVTVDGEVTITEAVGATVSGRLLNSVGKGVSGTEVTLVSTTGEVFFARSNKNGVFEFRGVTFGETYTVIAESDLFTFAPLNVSVVGESTRVDMIANQ
ncbi:MAG: cohesin domain-containing protein [Pyrinomonadaceae bacterium]